MLILNLYAKPGYRMSIWKRIKWWFRRAKYARQRARWGFSEYDVWDFEAYHAELVAAMMRYWAKHNHSYHKQARDVPDFFLSGKSRGVLSYLVKT